MTSQVQFGRYASLIVADAKGNGIDLSALQFVFSITHASIQTPQIADITIYNLSDATVNQIEQEFSQLQLVAGYQSNHGLIFKGTIAQKKKGRLPNAVDSYVEIFGQSGDAAYNHAAVNQTLAAGYTHADVLTTLAKTLTPFGVSAAATPAFPSTVFPRGRVLYGNTKDHARNLAMSTGMSWNIDNGQLHMLPSSGPSGTEAIVLTPQTGLLGIPEQTLNGISVRALLNPNIKINSMIDLKNTQVNQANLNLDYTAVNFIPKISGDGIYRVLYVEHAGDTRGDEWETSLICLDPNAPAPITPSVLGVGFNGPA
jgi:hypothetical protein